MTTTMSREDLNQLLEAYWFLFLPVFERIRNMAKRYSPELTDRAVRMVADRLGDNPSVTQWQAIQKIASKLGVSNESLRRWYDQHLIDSGKKGGVTREEHEEIKRLKRKNAQLRRANEILKLASAFSRPNSTTPGANDRVH